MQLGTLNIHRTENKNFASCQFHIESDAAASVGGLCVNSEQAIFSFVCFMFGYRAKRITCSLFVFTLTKRRFIEG